MLSGRAAPWFFSPPPNSFSSGLPLHASTTASTLRPFFAAPSPMGISNRVSQPKVFRGTLSDSNGIPSCTPQNFGAVRSIDTKLTAVILALFLLLAILAIYRAWCSPANQTSIVCPASSTRKLAGSIRLKPS